MELNQHDLWVRDQCKTDPTELDVSAYPKISNRALACISQLTRLQRLDLSGCLRITAKGLDYLLHCRSLQQITLDGCDQFSPQDKLPLTVRFDIDLDSSADESSASEEGAAASALSPNGLQLLKFAQSCPDAGELNLSDVFAVTDLSVLPLFTRLRSLKVQPQFVPDVYQYLPTTLVSLELWRPSSLPSIKIPRLSICDYPSELKWPEDLDPAEIQLYRPTGFPAFDLFTRLVTLVGNFIVWPSMLPGWTNLRELEIPIGPSEVVPELSLEILPKLPTKLQHLRLRQWHFFRPSPQTSPCVPTGKIIAALPTQLTGLTCIGWNFAGVEPAFSVTSLSLIDCKDMDGEAFAAMTQLKKLEFLGFGPDTPLALPSSLETLALWSRLGQEYRFKDGPKPRLRELELTRIDPEPVFKAIDPSGLKKFTCQLKNQCFSASLIAEIPDGLLDLRLLSCRLENGRFLKRLSFLRVFHLVDCDGIENEDIARASQTISDLILQDNPKIDQDIYGFLPPSCLSIVNIAPFPQTRAERFRRSLTENVIGQRRAIDAVVRRLAYYKSGTEFLSQPAAVLFFVGPSGVGKTQLGKTIATALFDAGIVPKKLPYHFQAMERFQGEDTGSLQLFGTETGWQDNKKGGDMLNQVSSAKGGCVLLLDEIEKANEKLKKSFLSVLDEGRAQDFRVDDGKGKKKNAKPEEVMFKNSIIIFTSNLGRDKFNDMASMSDEQLNQAIDAAKAEIAHNVAPEFVGRLSEIVPFCPLSREEVKGVLELKCRQFARETTRQSGFKVEIDARSVVMASLVNEGTNTQTGVRPVANALYRDLQTALARAKARKGGTHNVVNIRRHVSGGLLGEWKQEAASSSAASKKKT